VTFGDRLKAPLLWVSNANGQESIAIQVPCDAAVGSSPVTINVGGGSKTGTVNLRQASPGILESVQSDGVSRAVLVRPDGSFVDVATNPARRGEIVRLYATGLGQTTPPVGTNQVAVPGPDSVVAGNVIVGVANSGVRVVSAVLTREIIGVYEVTFEIPSDASATNSAVLSVAINPVGGGPTQFSRGAIIPIL
jgi:uncharacterized protein (TIGR03437 family)